MICKTVTCSLCFMPFVVAQYSPAPRWAQAVALQDDTLYVHGGLSDPFNSFSYTSAPGISDLLVLDLSTSFNASSAPWQLLSTASSPALAWHTLSAFSTIDLLLFGGQPGPDSSTVLTTRNDSSGLLSTYNSSAPSFLMESQSWANEPMRRIRHSASFTGDKVWVIGGERADGSGNAFNEHYSFDPSGPEFVQLPSSSNAPQDIYGHTSLVLPDGRLLVLGGYCASCAALVPMNVAWSLDTTQDPPVWEMLSISNESLPSPRRDFAAVILPNGQVFIHGGGDAQLQTTYGDGWTLDTGQNPMVWSGVPALAQLGARKDHFAVQANGYVLFCFGYGSSSPASASLFIYDPTTSSMVSSYSAASPGSTPAITSLAAPSQTGSKPNSEGGTGTALPVGPSGAPPNTSGASSDSSKRATDIALGTVFGFLGLVAGCLATIYYMKRHNGRKRTSGRFFPLPDDPESPSEESSLRGPAPEAARPNGQPTESTRGVGGPAVIMDILAHLGVDKFSHRPNRPRMDMFADEDTRSFATAGPLDAVQRRHSDRISIWSLRSVSALVRGVIGREPSGSGGDRESENSNHLRDGAREGLIREPSVPSEYSSHLTHQGDGSLWSYNDSLENPLSDDESEDIAEKEAVLDYAAPISDEISTSLGSQDSVWPFSVRSRILTPLREVSRTSLSDPSNSLPSIRDPSHGQITFGDVEHAALSPPSPMLHSPAISHASDSHVTTSAPQCSPVSGTTPSHSPTTSRPDSWWSRLTKSPLLDRRMSITSSKPLDFRDPTPAPPLRNIEDMKPSSASEASDDKHDDVPAQHGRTVSSAHSGRTANTDSAEHLGGRYDVVQRLPSDGSGSQRAPSLGCAEITEQGIYAVNVDARSEISSSSSAPDVDPPHSTSSGTGPGLSFDVEAPLIPPAASKSDPTPKNGVVASRVKAYERRMSQELESHQIPHLRNTRRVEQVPSRTRPTIQYGVAPRPSLFIANPDLGHL